MKIFWFDVETTGLLPWKHGIIQFAYLIEVDGVERERGSYRIQPFDTDEIDNKALEVNGVSREELTKYLDPAIWFSGTLLPLLGKYVNKFDRGDKFTPAGFNTDFDVSFLREFFKKNGDKFYGSWFNYDLIDPLQYLRFMQPKVPSIQSFPDKKLGTVCERFGVSLEGAHEAMADIIATRDLCQVLWEQSAVKSGSN